MQGFDVDTYTCKHDYTAPSEKLTTLPYYQGGLGRHRCATCAYVLGLSRASSNSIWFACEHGNAAPPELFDCIDDSQGGPGRHKCVTCAYAAGLEENASDASEEPTPDDALPDGDDDLTEGEAHHVTATRIERNRRARALCLEHHGYSCKVCGLLMEKAYGDLGKDVVQVHHIRPLRSTKGRRTVDPIADLVPVCPNCHVMLHRQDPPLSIDELKSRL